MHPRCIRRNERNVRARAARRGNGLSGVTDAWHGGATPRVGGIALSNIDASQTTLLRGVSPPLDPGLHAVELIGRDGNVLARVENGIEVRVSDTGEGIAPDVLPFVFDRFRQGDSTITRRHGGLGLGLALVRHLAELHEGTVHAESPGEGYGATFTIHLPALDGAAAGPEPAAPARPLQGVQVLVVEDDPDSLDMLSFLLGEAGASTAPYEF